MLKTYMNKVIVSFIVFLGIVMVVCTSHATPIVSIQPPIAYPTIGTNFSVDFAISGVTDLYAWQFALTFDPTIINAIDITEGPFLSSGGSTTFIKGTINNTLGQISLTGDSLIGLIPGVTGSGILASIQFDALAAGFSPITLNDVKLVNSSLGLIDFTAQNGAANPVPEPATVLLLGSGLVGLAGFGRKKFFKK